MQGVIKNGKQGKGYRRAGRILFVLYVVVLIKLLFFKLTIVFSTIAISGNENATFKTLFASSNFIPFYRIYYYASGQEPYLVGLLNVAGNVLLFVPMGFFLPLFFKRLNTALRVAMVAAGLSLLVETLQLFTTTGEFDVDDTILNTVGALMGYWVVYQIAVSGFFDKFD